MKVDYVFFFLHECRTDSAPILGNASTALWSVATTYAEADDPTFRCFPIIGLGGYELSYC